MTPRLSPIKLIGDTSPNAVAPALKRWRASFAAQLQGEAGAAHDVLPAGVLEIVQALWSRALFEAHRVRSEARSTADALEQLHTAIAELNARLAALQAREAQLDAERREIAAQRRRLAALESGAARKLRRPAAVVRDRFPRLRVKRAPLRGGKSKRRR